MNKKLIIPILIMLLVFGFSLACTSKSAETNEETAKSKELTTEEDTQEAEEEQIETKAEPIEDVELPSPNPMAGCGNVAGRVFWNSKPVNEARVLLCEDFNVFSGCEGETYESSTDEKGVYIVENIPVGEYAILMQLPGEENYIFAGDTLFGATEIKIEEGKTIPLDDMHIFKTDLILTAPSDNEEIETRKPALSWKSYQDADYYLIFLYPEAGHIGQLIDEKVKETSYQVESELLNCNFSWKIEAFNQYGRKIAESEYGHFFVKVDCPSCYLKVLTPADKEKIKQGNAITLSWEEHPMAANYNISVRNTETGEYPVDSVEIDATSYKITESIPEGEYYFSVDAIDSSGIYVAYGSGYFMVIK